MNVAYASADFFKLLYSDIAQDRIKRKIIAFILVTIIFALIYVKFTDIKEWNIGATQHSMTFYDSVHFSIVTLATVGYGDIYPITTKARVLTHLEILIGFIVLSI